MQSRIFSSHYSSVSHNHKKIIIICWLAHETFLIIINLKEKIEFFFFFLRILQTESSKQKVQNSVHLKHIFATFSYIHMHIFMHNTKKNFPQMFCMSAQSDKLKLYLWLHCNTSNNFWSITILQNVKAHHFYCAESHTLTVLAELFMTVQNCSLAVAG